MTASTATLRLIEDLTQKYGKDTADKLVAYIDMVLDRNQFINLTAVRDRDEAMQKHLADSLSITGLPEYEQARWIIDIGTGAGFPGALLAIVSPEKQFVLLDSTLKRLKVIDEFAHTLDIPNITVLHARAEEIGKAPKYKGQFDLAVSRAVAGMDKLCGWCLPFVRAGGDFIAYKGENYETELKTADRKIKAAGGRVDRIEEYSTGGDEISGHVLVVVKKIK